MKKLLGLLSVGLLIVFPVLAHAQLDFTLDPAAQAGKPGDTLTFTGTLKNTGTTTLFLNGDNFTLPGTGLSLDDTAFLTGAPLSLDGGESYTGPFFDILFDPNAPPQSVSGTFSVLGGADENALDTLASQNFGVAVVPEPMASLNLLMGLGLLGSRGWRRVRKR
ncbi:MAG TPA: hypothetical protein VFB21_23435 [Chthonomonadaceae bacterium]|nr:hypothetical protein [Chthonomonadaceae bacterium]